MISRFGDKDTPLAFKPCIINPDRKLFFVSQDTGMQVRITGRRIYRMQKHEGHGIPIPNCTCGILSTINSDWLMDAIFYPDHRNGNISAVMMVQVLGQFEIDTAMNIRSEMIYPYRIIVPQKTSCFNKLGEIKNFDFMNDIQIIHANRDFDKYWMHTLNARYKEYGVLVTYDWSKWTKEIFGY